LFAERIAVHGGYSSTTKSHGVQARKESTAKGIHSKNGSAAKEELKVELHK
jgi:hypothetical protein